uniref:Uncharacterized protein n=1 Tax=Panagrolaimus davidi TaxID=227884 RepID=A0A914PSB6_9BILA
MYENLTIKAGKMFGNTFELGTVCVFLGHNDFEYGNGIRKKFVSSGLASGFKNVEIIDLFVAIFYDALRQSKFHPVVNSVVWIHNYGSWYLWKKMSAGQSELIHYENRGSTWIDDELIQKFEKISGKKPDIVVFGHPVRDYLVSYFSSKYDTFIFENFYFAKGALFYAKIMADKSKYLDYAAKIRLGHDVKLVVGMKEVLHFQRHENVPLDKVLKLKNANDLNLNVSFCS